MLIFLRSLCFHGVPRSAELYNVPPWFRSLHSWPSEFRISFRWHIGIYPTILRTEVWDIPTFAILLMDRLGPTNFFSYQFHCSISASSEWWPFIDQFFIFSVSPNRCMLFYTALLGMRRLLAIADSATPASCSTRMDARVSFFLCMLNIANWSQIRLINLNKDTLDYTMLYIGWKVSSTHKTYMRTFCIKFVSKLMAHSL